MKKKALHIAEPCSESWDAMDGEDATRFCGQCDKHVHNLSGMTQHDADALLATPERVCVRYTSTKDGEVLFRDSKNPTWRLSLQAQGARRLAQAALIALPLALSACLPAEDTTPVEVVSPIVVKNGEPVKVGVSSTPQKTSDEKEACDPTPAPEELVVEMGEPPMIDPPKPKKTKKKDKVLHTPDKHSVTMGKIAVEPKVKLLPKKRTNKPKPKPEDQSTKAPSREHTR